MQVDAQFGLVAELEVDQRLGHAGVVAGRLEEPAQRVERDALDLALDVETGLLGQVLEHNVDGARVDVVLAVGVAVACWRSVIL